MIESWKQSGLAAVAVAIAILIGGGLQAWSLGNASASVLVWDVSASPIPLSPPETALEYASSIAGVNVVLPTYLPPGYALVEIDVQAKVAPAKVLFRIVNGNAQFYIVTVYAAGPSIFADPNAVIASPSADSRVVKGVHRETIGYTLLTRTRQVSLQTGGPNQITEAEAVRVLGSLPQD